MRVERAPGAPVVSKSAVADPDGVARRHAFHPLAVKQVIEETDDTRSFVLDVPDDLAEVYGYRPGQFCTFRVRIGADEYFRCYSMSSAPETDGDLAVTVKRVPGGTVSNWFNDQVSVGALVDTSPPAGAFCLRAADRPIVGFCGGSGITPVISLAKSALSSTGRSVRLLYASRAPDSVIFDEALGRLESQSSGAAVGAPPLRLGERVPRTCRPSSAWSEASSTPTSTCVARARSWRWSRRPCSARGRHPRRS